MPIPKTPVFRGGYGPPFRPPCSGWLTPRRIFYGGPYQHKRASDEVFNGFQNTTTVPNPNCGNNYGFTTPACGSCGPAQPAQVPPFRWPDSVLLPVPCNTPPSSPPCNPWSFNPELCGFTSTPPPRLNNNYTLYFPPRITDMSLCRMRGFKNVFAMKNWQGQLPWNCNEVCDPCNPSGTASSPNPTLVKYRTVTWDAKSEYVAGAGSDVYEEMSGSSTIDRLSGKLGGSSTFSQFEAQPGADPGAPFRLLLHTSNDILPEDLLSCRKCNGLWTCPDQDGSGVGPELAGILNGTLVGAGVVVNTATESDTQIVIDVTNTGWNGPGSSFHWSCTITLSLPYTSDNVNTDCNTLLAQWDMSNHALYPWRTDLYCTRGPVVTYYEKGGIPQILKTADLSGTYTWTGPTGTYTYNKTDPIVDTDPYDGSIIGKPNPFGPFRADGTVTDRWWDAQHKVCEWIIVGGSPTTIDTQCYGDYAPNYCPSATQWTDDLQAATFLPGACAQFSGTGGVLIKSKWAEVILLTFPSHNYGRPWGYRDSLLRDQSTVDCTCNPPWANQYGNLLFPSCPGVDGQVAVKDASNTSPITLTLVSPVGCRVGDVVDVVDVVGNTAANGPLQSVSAVSVDGTQITLGGTTGNGVYVKNSGLVSTPGANSPSWNDTQPKGDWCLMTWTYDLRNSPGTYTSNMTQQCSLFLPCCPATVYITPQDFSQPVGETNFSKNSKSYPHPNLALDSCYGSLWQSIPKQVMTDPLWQRPVKPCDRKGSCGGQGSDNGLVWTEDDGTGFGDTDTLEYFPQRPLEECRVAVPPGAPSLPGGYSMLRNDDRDPGNLPPVAPGQVYSGPIGGCGQPAGSVSGAAPNGYWLPVWFWQANREKTIQTSGRFACEYADSFAVCSSGSSADSEVTPL